MTRVDRCPPTRPDDPAYSLLTDDFTTTPVIYRDDCYICVDPEFAQMGLPLCRICPKCGGHVPADDSICDECQTCDICNQTRCPHDIQSEVPF